ncbi:uncharacterized protein LOC116261416 isoform X2 [Nymphaea colorata]|uniref:uncharacterized protein LOC116261416 isoform X2 n=1 Tax=Nymphaea colorata TaxID=210225 RepID=UPI00129E0CF3|nr:uncharacterized protein LOC116261416 isoform X2 [Nymphaea colorata]
MEETLPAMDVVLDVENTLPSDKCSRSPKLIRALSRKGSCRTDRPPTEEHETDEPLSRAAAKCVQGGAASQLDAFKQPVVPNKPLLPLTSSATCTLSVPGDNEGRCKKFNRLTAMHPRKILLIFATLSSMGTIILIYFTLSIHKSAGVQHGK